MCHLLALLGAHHILHVSRMRVNLQNVMLSYDKTHLHCDTRLRGQSEDNLLCNCNDFLKQKILKFRIVFRFLWAKYEMGWACGAYG